MMPQDVVLSGMEGVQWAQLELTGLCSGWLTEREQRSVLQLFLYGLEFL